MTTFLIPAASKVTAEGLFGSLVAPLYSAGGQVTHYLVNDASGVISSASAVAAGATVYPSVEAAITASGSARSVGEAVQLNIHAKARQALAVNATFLALATPTNAQNAAQLKALTRECSALIRLLIGADLLVENTDT